MKYIVKNCNYQDMCDEFYAGGCKNIFDCLIKQVIEKCIDYPKQCEGNCIDNRCCTSCFLGGGCELAEEILQLLEIEECGE